MDFHQQFQDALQQEDPLMALRQTIIDLRAEGFSKNQLQSELESFHSVVTNEADEDLVVDVMDFLWGFCSPHMRID